MRSTTTVRTCIGVLFKTTANLWESKVYQLECREQTDEMRSTRANPWEPRSISQWVHYGRDEEDVQSFLSECFPPDSKRDTSGVITATFGETIIHALNNPAAVDKSLCFYIKKHGFHLLDLPSLGVQEVLVVPGENWLCLTSAIISLCTSICFFVECRRQHHDG